MLRKLPAVRQASAGLERSLELRHVLGLGVATIVGSGIFVVLGPITKLYGGSLSFLSFPLAAIPALCSALCYGEFASRFSCAGQAYTYLYMSLGEVFGYIAGILTVFSYLVATSAVAKGFQLYTLDAVFVAPGLLIACTMLCLLGIRESAKIGSYFAAANCTFLVLLMVYGGYNYGKLDTLVQHFQWPDMNGLLQAAGLAYFTTLGWDLICVISGEMVEPERDVVFGLVGALSVVTILYSSLALVFLTIMEPAKFDLDKPLVGAFADRGDELGAFCVSLVAGFICISSVLSGILAPPRILQRMAHDGLIFSFFQTNNKSNVPIYGTILTGICGSILVVTLDFENLAKLTSAASLVIFSLVSVALLKLRRESLSTVPVLLLCSCSTATAMGSLPVILPIFLVAWSLWEWHRAAPTQTDPLEHPLLGEKSDYACPLVPWLPLASMLMNSCILASLGEAVVSETTLLFIGSLILYLAYGRTHSALSRTPSRLS